MLTVVTDNDTFSLSVSTDMTVENLKAILEADSGIPSAQQVLTFNGQPLADDSKSLASYSIGEDDLLMLAPRAGPSRGAGSSGGASRQLTEDEIAAELLRQIRGNAQAMAQLRASQPQVAAAIEAGNVALFKQFLEQQRAAMAAAGGAGRLGAGGPSQEMLDLANADPFDPEAQARIEEAIRQERVLENMEHAMEYSPESFGRVTMLYVDAHVNSTNVKAFVDSGAQATIMSPECAERCGIMRLIDRRFAGIARGVGTAKILGRVHSAEIRLGEKLYLPCSFTIMEGKGVELLFGLDMLKRFQAVIDLKQNALLVGEEKIRFLDEHELPAAARLDNAGEDEEGAEQEQAQASGSGSGSGSLGIGEAAKRNAEAAAGAAMRTGHFPGQGQSLGSAAASGSTAQRSVEGSGVSFEHRPAGSAPSAPAAPAQAPSSAAGGSTSASAPASGPRQWPAASIKSLTDLGASEAQAKAMLDAAGGNVDIAASLLFQ